jgi:hypothetical protein
MKIILWQMFRGGLIVAILSGWLVTSAVCAGASPSWVQAQSFGGSGNDAGYTVKVGCGGAQYFAGSFSSTVQFGDTQLVSFGGADAFLAKRDSTGEVVWAIQAGGSSNDFAYDLALDKADNIYVTGEFYNDATFGSTDGKDRSVSGNGYTIFLARYSSTGVLAWVQTGVIAYGGDYNWGDGVAVEPTTGTVYVAGISQTDTTFSSADGTNHVVPGNGAWHMVLAKYNTNGIFQWGETNSASINSAGYSVAVDAKANAYVVGWFENQSTFFSHNGHDITITGFSPADSDSDYPSDAFLVKYDSQGNAQWANHIGGYKAIGNAVAVSPAGEISLAGFIGNIDYGTGREKTTTVTSQPPGQNQDLGGGDYTNPYNRDIVIATWDGTGVLERALRVGGQENETANGVAYDATGRLWVTGGFQGTLKIGSQTLVGNNQQNLFLLQFSGNTFLQGASAVNAGILGERMSGISVGPAGGIAVTGPYEGTAVFGNTKLTSEGGSDIFLSRLNPN